MPNPNDDLGLNTQGNVQPKKLSNDEAVLRQLIGELNNPVLTGARLPKEEALDNQKILSPRDSSKELPMAFPAEIPHAEQQSQSSLAPQLPIGSVTIAENSLTGTVMAPALSQVPAKIFITGRQSAIEKLLGGLSLRPSAALVSLNVTCLDVLRETCSLKGTPPAPLVSTFRAWGDGEATKHPYTIERLLLLGLIRKSFADFGTAGFWAKLVLGGVPSQLEQAILVGVQTKTEFTLLQKAGFIHYHAWSNTLPSMGEQSSDLLHVLDNDSSRQISAQRTGAPKLRVVWMDDKTRCPSPDRLIFPEEFRKSVVSADAPVVESALVI